MEHIINFCKGANTFFYYLFHPVELLSMAWGGVVNLSLPICTLIFLIALLLFMAGWSKGRKIATGSLFVFIIIHMLNAAL